jgi:hypothetical protein
MTRATRAKLFADLRYSGRRFALYGNFGMSSFGRWGVRFRKLPWRVETIAGDPVSAEMLARMFRQRVGASGRASVLARRTKQRNSIELLVAPALARAFAERHIDKSLKHAIATRFPVVLQQEAKFLSMRRKT